MDEFESILLKAKELSGELYSSIPNNPLMDPIPPLELPLWGFGEPKKHILATNPTISDVWRNMSKMDILSLSMTFWNTLSRWSLSSLSYTAKYLNTRIAELLFALDFFGVQEMYYEGITEYKDRNMNSFDNYLKHVMNPNEFILFGHPIHSMTDGQIIAVSCDNEDKISNEPMENSGITFRKASKAYGNYVTILADCHLIFTYFGLMKNSAKHRVGMKVKAGDLIGNVGCQGVFGTKPFLHIVTHMLSMNAQLFARYFPGSKANILLANNPVVRTYTGSFIPIPALKFKPFNEYSIIKGNTLDEAKLKVYSRDIKYTRNNGSIISNGLFVKK